MKKRTHSIMEKFRGVGGNISASGCKYTSSSAVCIAPGQRCSCCGRLRFAPKPCGPPQTLPEFELSPIEKKTPLNETISCEATEHPCDRAAVIVNSVNHSCENSSSIICGDKGLAAREYTEKDVGRFVKIIEQKLAESLERNKSPACADFEVHDGENDTGCFGERIEGKFKDSWKADRTSVCPGGLMIPGLPEAVMNFRAFSEFENVEGSEVSTERSVRENICTFRESVISANEKNHRKNSVAGEDCAVKDSSVDEIVTNGENNADFMESQDFCKWGETDTADRILAGDEKAGANVIRRLSCMDRKCFSTLCRQLFRWSYRLSKKWRDLTGRPHIVIHLPSMGYPVDVRRRASERFDLLQNVQVTRLGWLANENAQVVYVVPNDQGVETITLFRDLIKNVRPDVAENRLWIIQPEGEKCFKTGCLNGSRALFQSTKTFQRLQMLTAGRRAFLLPGVMEEIDVFIASKLRAPVMGPPLEFQNYFLKKSNVANFLKEIDVDQPPFVPDVGNFSELCRGLARLMITYPRYATWLIKINYGFNGLQTGSINFEKSPSREIIAAKNIEKILVVDIDPHYTDVIAFTDWVKFCLCTTTSATTKMCARHSRQSGILECEKIENDVKKRRTSKKRNEISNSKDSMERYAICSGKICSNGLARYCGSSLVSLCEERNVRYNFKIKQGSMICPIDSERRALGLVSLHPKRFRAIEEFAKALRVLHEISMEKPNENIKTNMLQSPRTIDHLDIRSTSLAGMRTEQLNAADHPNGQIVIPDNGGNVSLSSTT
ncbi:uncharacterized protein LOC105687443 [Athalia rosae]|uniref:uncharacterized protein LOC105687443 n=1 Tax=Athalia rosae TaxID=37344 RepID=UPI0020336E54|nr:uncharacterized protein LOC105687443 [Athalia rosae]